MSYHSYLYHLCEDEEYLMRAGVRRRAVYSVLWSVCVDNRRMERLYDSDGG